MGALVCDHVVTGAAPARLDILPGQNHGSLVPCLSAQYLVAGMHDARLVDALAVPYQEFLRVDDHRVEVVVAIEAKTKYRPARQHGDAQAHRVIELQSAGRFQALLVEKQQCQGAKPLKLRRAKPRQRGDVGDRLLPERIGDCTARKDLPPPPASEQSEHGQMIANRGSGGLYA